MSRAFVTDKEDWTYCAKAGERCMHAVAGKACSNTSCEHFDRAVKAPPGSAAAVKVVTRKPKDPQNAKAANTQLAQPRRATKKSTLKKPKKWGGRSGG